MIHNMDGVDIILVLVIVYILYTVTKDSGKNDKKKKKNNTKKNRKEKFDTSFRKYSTRKDYSILADDIMDDIVSWDDSYDSVVLRRDKVNPNFINNQFHNDYRDIITALNNLVPDRKQLFNLANIPVVYSEPEADEVKNLVADFVTVLNENLISEVPSYRNPNSGWDEAIPDPNMKSGWDKVQESLGLAPSLYNNPAPKSGIRLISVTYVQKYETDDEIKYSCDIVLQKYNVEDQIILKAGFVQDKRTLRDENNFFVTTNVEMKVMIEDVYIVGYMSRDGNDAKLTFDGDEEKFYDYNQLEYNNMTDPKYVQKILMQKYKQRTEEMEQRNAMLDEEGQAFHKELPHIYDFSNIKGTQTIFDDMNYHKTFT